MRTSWIVILLTTIGMLSTGCQRSRAIGDASVSSQPSTSSSADFVLTYRTVGGAALGTGLYERQTTLQVDRPARMLSLELHRWPADNPGSPIGQFRGPLSEADAAKVQRGLQDAHLDRPPKPTGGSLSGSLLTLECAYPDRKLAYNFNSQDYAALDQFDGLLTELNRLTAAAAEHPLRAVTLSVEPPSGDMRGPFRLVVTNIGTEPLAIADARTMSAMNEEYRAGVRIAALPEERPGFTSPPLQWACLDVETASNADHEQDVRLQPGEQVSWPTAPWRSPQHHQKYLVQGVFSNYAGSSMVEETYRIRGCVFSRGVEVTPP